MIRPLADAETDGRRQADRQADAAAPRELTRSRSFALDIASGPPVTDGETILWRRLDVSGHEIATITSNFDGWLLSGVAVFAELGDPCRVEYEIRCDTHWVTRRCLLRGSIGAKPVTLEIARNEAAEWSLDAVQVASIRGCDDIDLGFSPSTKITQRRWVAAGLQFGTVAAYLVGAWTTAGSRALWLALAWNVWSIIDAARRAAE